MPTLSPRIARFAAAFASAAGFTKNPPAPERAPAPDFCSAQTANYTQLKQNRPCHIAHFPTSKDHEAALCLVRWVFAVAKLPADSPRFAYYVSRWDVPGKIARAINDGSFDAAVANCPPIDPTWVRFVPAALEAHRQFIATHTRPKAEQTASSGTKARAA